MTELFLWNSDTFRFNFLPLCFFFFSLIKNKMQTTRVFFISQTLMHNRTTRLLLLYNYYILFALKWCFELNLLADGRVGAGTVLCGDPVPGQFLREHLHAGSCPAPPAGLSRLVPLDHRSHRGYLAHPACGVKTSSPFYFSH